MRDLKLPSYEGLYGRAFLPPVMILSVGRWGSKAASRFFHYVSATFPSRDISSCFARIAVVRDGIAGYQQDWTTDIVTWPELNGPKLPLHADSDTQELWTTPRSAFESVAGQLYTDLARIVTRRFAWLDLQDGWRQQAHQIGLTVPAVAQNVQHWIAILANIYEPEVATVLVRFMNEFQHRVPMVNTDCRYLFLVDAGLPDEPEEQTTPWTDLPPWLAEEALRGINELQVSYPAIAYFLSESNRAGRTEAEGGRVAIAAGIMRALFCSQFLDSRTRPEPQTMSGYWNELAILEQPADVGMERVAHFIEFALDAENLPGVAAHEVMARWRSSISNTAQELSPDTMKQDILKALSGSESPESIIDRWLQTWTTDGLPQSALTHFQTLLSWTNDEQNIDDADFERTSALATTPPPSSDPIVSAGPLKRLKRLFGTQPQVPTRDYVGQANVIKRRMLIREEIRNRLKFGLEFFGKVYREDGPFHDTIYDTHYWREQWDQRTIVLKLRRLPLQADCPPAIQKIVSDLSNDLPTLMLQCATQSPSADAFIDQLQTELSNRCKELLDSGDATIRWNTYGFAQWLATDPQLVRLVAEILCEQFIVPWRPIAGHDWQGHLTVFSFETPGNRDRHGAARNGWNRLALEIGQRDAPSQPLIGSAQPVVADFNPDTDLLWVRWPQILSIGFFWFESSTLGQRFVDAVDHEPLRSTAGHWIAAHPEHEPLLAFSLPYRATGKPDTSSDSEQLEEV